MPVDDAEATRRLAELEIEAKAELDAQRARKEAVIAKLREQQAKKQAEKDQLTERQAAIVKKPASKLDDALVLAKGAQMVGQAKAELTRPREKGEKSWMASTALSLFFGPVGWLYAGSFREAIPAGFIYIVLAAILSKLPMFLVWPVMMVGLPLSAIGGLVYAIQYNRHGKRTRIFDKEKKDEAPKKLRPGR